jgi:hypothetical protein
MNSKQAGPRVSCACIDFRKKSGVSIWEGLAIPGKAVRQHRHPLHLSVPFAAEHLAGQQRMFVVCGNLLSENDHTSFDLEE